MDYNYCMKQSSCNGCKRNLSCGKEKKMERTIRIGTKEFKMSASAYTQFKYKNDLGRSYIKDLTKISKQYNDLQKEVSEEEALEKFDDLDDFITTILRIAYIMSCEAKSISGSFEDFLMQIDDYYNNTDWISEVVDLAISPLSGKIQTSQVKQLAN